MGPLGAMFLVAGVNPRPLPLNDSPDKTQHELSDVVSDEQKNKKFFVEYCLIIIGPGTVDLKVQDSS